MANKHPLSVEQYRQLVAHMMYWKLGFQQALADCGLPTPDMTIDEIMGHITSCGYEYDDETNTLAYTL